MKRLQVLIAALVLTVLSTVQVLANFRNFSDYMYITEIEITEFHEIIWFWTRDEVSGLHHSNSAIGIKYTPIFHDLVTCSAEDFIHGYGYNPQFDIGYILNWPRAYFPIEMLTIRSAALEQGNFIENEEGLLQYRCTGGEDGWNIVGWRVGVPFNEDAIEWSTTTPYGPALAIFVNGSLQLQGSSVSGNTTIGAAENIYLIDDLRYDDYVDVAQNIPENSPNFLYVVSESNIFIGDTPANGMGNGIGQGDNHNNAHIVITSFLFSLGEQFSFEHQNDFGDAYCWCPPCPNGLGEEDERGTIFLRGSLAQKRRGYTHRSTCGGTGYERNYLYDERFLEHPSPFIPEIDWEGWSRDVFEVVQPTEEYHSFLVNNATLNGLPLNEANEIAVYDGDLCVGAASIDGPWGGFPLVLTAWQENQINQQLDLPGFMENNPINFKVWSAEYQRELEANVTYIEGDNDGVFVNDGFSRIELEVIAPETRVPLHRNYFELASTNRVPVNLNARSVFGEVQNLMIVYQDNGRIFFPPNLNTMGDISLTKGYRIYCSAESEWRIGGELMDPETEYSITAGRWNWIGYPFDFPLWASLALSPIYDVLIIAQNDRGGMVLPPWLPNFVICPGDGLYIFTSEDVAFQYNSNQLLAEDQYMPSTSISNQDDSVTATGLPYVVIVHLTEALKQQNPTTIELYDNSLLVGKATVLEDYEITPVIAWEGSPEYGLPGFKKGDPIIIQVKSAEGLQLSRFTDDQATFGKDPYTEVTLDFLDSVIPKEFSVASGYPNPFNPSITVPFVLPSEGEVTFTVFNVLGQTVYQDLRVYQTGHCQFVFNADIAEVNLVSGLYFLQVQYQSEKHVQKVILLK